MMYPNPYSLNILILNILDILKKDYQLFPNLVKAVPSYTSMACGDLVMEVLDHILSMIQLLSYCVQYRGFLF